MVFYKLATCTLLLIRIQQKVLTEILKFQSPSEEEVLFIPS